LFDGLAVLSSAAHAAVPMDSAATAAAIAMFLFIQCLLSKTCVWFLREINETVSRRGLRVLPASAASHLLAKAAPAA
jgi:hypothetical protein